MELNVEKIISAALRYGFTPFILAGLMGFFLAFILVRSGRRKKFTNLPPRGPREWPVLGSLPSLAGKDLPHVILAKMARKYGPIFSMQMGSFYAVILSDFSLVRQALAKSNDEFSDRPKLTMVEHVQEGKGLIVSYFGSTQTEHRRFSLSALRSLGMGKFRMEETIAEEARHLAMSFAERHGKPFVPFHDIVVSVSNIICWLSLGKRFDYEDKTFKIILTNLLESFEITEIAGVFNFLPFLRFLPGSGFKRLLELKDNHDKFLKKIVFKVSEEQEKTRPSPRCYVEMYTEQMIEADRDNPGEHSFSKDNMYVAVADLFAAGTETTGTTIKWALLYMILHQDVQENIHKELDDVVGRNRLPRLTDRSSLPYTEATLLEVQRFATITPLAVPHAATYDTVFNGYDIPKGTVIIPNLWAIHHDPELWDNPNEFNPERFLDPVTKQVIQRDELIPFSIGRRKCLGEQLAKVELFIFFTHLLHRFRFSTPEGAPQLNIKIRNGATLNPEEFEICATLIDETM